MLYSQIQIGQPNIWVKTLDSYKALETVVTFPAREYFTITPNGFSQWINGKWKPVIVELPHPDDTSLMVPTTTYDFGLSFEYVQKTETTKPKTFIFNLVGNPQETISMYSSLFSKNINDYREIFWNNSEANNLIQMIVISNADAPEDYANLFEKTEIGYPSAEELTHVLAHVSANSDGIFINQQDVKDIVKAGLGFTEPQFINVILQSIVENAKVTSDYVYSKKTEDIKRNGILEIIKPKVSFDNVGGLDNIKDLIIRNTFLWNNPDKAKEFGIAPIRRMLMVGIPGTGKSAICEATAHALNLDLARTGVSQVMNSYIGQSEQNMRAVFGQIKAMAPLCVWIDEFGRDMSGGQTSSHVDGGTTDRVHGEFLTGLQELPQDVFLMCAANQLDHLKPEMLRADRFDKIMFVGLPSFSERIDILKIYLRDILDKQDFNLEAIAHSTKYFTGAEIKTLINEVKFQVSSRELRVINTNDIIEYAPKMRNILWNKSRDMIQNLYKTALEQWDWASSSQLEDARMILNPSRDVVSTPKVKLN